MHATQQIDTTDTARLRDVARIEELIGDLKDGAGTINALMLEHLEAARFYLLGGMPREYNFTLDLADQLLSEIENSNLQARVGNFLHNREVVT